MSVSLGIFLFLSALTYTNVSGQVTDMLYPGEGYDSYRGPPSFYEYSYPTAVKRASSSEEIQPIYVLPFEDNRRMYMPSMPKRGSVMWQPSWKDYLRSGMRKIMVSPNSNWQHYMEDLDKMSSSGKGNKILYVSRRGAGKSSAPAKKETDQVWLANQASFSAWGG